MRSFILAFISITLLSCAPIRVSYDYDQQVNFETYKTYNYFSDIETSLSEFDTKRLLDNLDNALQLKGMTLSDTPDFLIDIRSKEYEDINRNTVGVGLGSGGRNVGGGISVGIPLSTSKMQRQITIDFVEAKAQKLFWQAQSESSYNPNATPEQREANIKVIIDKILSGYPPK